MSIKLWLDDIRQAPKDYLGIKTVNGAKEFLSLVYNAEGNLDAIEEINLDHDAGDYASVGGDYIKLLDWLEEQNWDVKATFKFHSMNPVGRQNMMVICRKNGWKVD